MGRPGDELAEQLEAVYAAVMSVVSACAVCLGVLVNMLLLMHILTEKRENFKPRSVLYFLAISMMIFMWYKPPAKELKDVIF
jgi:hypothetical protein